MTFDSIRRQFGDAMSMTKSWILEAAATLEIQLQQMSSDEADEVFLRLRQEYADSDSALPLWETIGERESRKRANGWQDIGEYVGDSPCLLITEKDGQEVYRVPSGSDLTKLLAECPGFEFYITNDDYDCLLCHNHHDYLIGTGKSAEWVAAKPDDDPASPPNR
jgi:hypothetical protein